MAARLCWRGVKVSKEFQAYAARIARGEELEPYRGQVLADASLEFPWNSLAARPPRGGSPRVFRLSLVALALVAAVMTTFVLVIGEAASPRWNDEAVQLADNPTPVASPTTPASSPSAAALQGDSAALAPKDPLPTARRAARPKAAASRPARARTALGGSGITARPAPATIRGPSAERPPYAEKGAATTTANALLVEAAPF